MATGPIFYDGMKVPAVRAHRLGNSVITIAGGAKLVCASAQFTYRRDVNYIQPLNLDEMILVAGTPQGSLTLGTVIGPSQGIKDFLRIYSNTCSPTNNSISISGANACGQGGSDSDSRFTFSGLVINGMQGGVSRTEGGNILMASIELSFVSMT